MLIVMALAASACQQNTGAAGSPGTAPEGFNAIGADEAITALGNEPFWNATITGSSLVYKTPENIEGSSLSVDRFTGQGGLGFSGQFEGAAFDLLITAGECSDTMSDRTYPYTATLRIGEEQRNGCAYTDKQMFSGDESP